MQEYTKIDVSSVSYTMLVLMVVMYKTAQNCVSVVYKCIILIALLILISAIFNCVRRGNVFFSLKISDYMNSLIQSTKNLQWKHKKKVIIYMQSFFCEYTYFSNIRKYCSF